MAQKISKHLTFLSEMWMTRSEYQYSHLLKHTSQGSSSWVYVPNLCDHVVVQTNKAVHILYFRQHRMKNVSSCVLFLTVLCGIC